MKRCIMGLWLLIALLGIGILTCWGTKLLLEPISRDLEKAAELVIGENWEEAQALTRQAREKWEKWWSFTAALTSHAPMENADNWFARLDVFAKTGDARRYGEGCVKIAGLIRAIGEGQIPNLRNLF